ncbi:MAG: hypothetical protein P8P99_03615 [Maricaulis sp.]|nr:hypothetical protein [Maricaulis sp.]
MSKNTPTKRLQPKKRIPEWDTSENAEFKNHLINRFDFFIQDKTEYRGFTLSITFDLVAKFKKTDFERLYKKHIKKAPRYCWNVINRRAVGRGKLRRLLEQHDAQDIAPVPGLMTIERQTKERDYAGAHVHGVFFLTSNQWDKLDFIEAGLNKHFKKIWPDADVKIKDVIDRDAVSYCLKDEGRAKDGKGSWLDHVDYRIPSDAMLAGIDY